MLEDEARKLPPEEEVNWCRLPSLSFAVCLYAPAAAAAGYRRQAMVVHVLVLPRGNTVLVTMTMKTLPQ